MPSPALTKDLQASLRSAFAQAAQLRHEYVTLEHLLLALLSNRKTRSALKACGANLDSLQADIEQYLEDHFEKVQGQLEISPVPTVALDRVLQRAAIHVLSTEQSAIESAAVLVQMFKEPESYAVYLLEQQGITDFVLKQYFSHGITPDNEDFLPEDGHAIQKADETEEDEGEADSQSGAKVLERFCLNLNAEAAAGRIDPLVGREKELERLVHVLARRRKNNPVLLGDPGVGKTALIEGLALRIHEGRVPAILKESTVYALDMGALLAGTKFRGQFEERLKAVMKALTEHEDAIVFIDEIHTIVGAGAVSGGSMDASNILKPALASGKIRCIGSTTFQEYKASFDRDRALARRFQTIEIGEPTVEETIEILKGLKKHYESHHQVVYSDDALTAAAQLASVHINERFMPDKAIDVVDEAGAWVRLNRPANDPAAPSEVTVADIERVVSRMARIPEKNVSAQDKSRLKDLATDLKAVIFGQDQAIETIASQIKLSRAGLRSREKPIGSFLFSGPTGVGKTELAKQLAKTLGIEFIRFDMSEYSERHTVSRLIGAPPGYVGFDQGGLLTDAVRKHPHAVVVLDEIEKAHPDLFNLLLQVMDHATLTDNNGRRADFRHVILIMTTNAGAFEMTAKSVGFGNVEDSGRTMDTSRAQKAIERTFTPEFRNRLDAWVIFAGLPKEIILKVVDKELALLQAQLDERKIKLNVSAEAKAWLAEKGYDPAFGARPMSRLVETSIKKPLADFLLIDETAKVPETIHVDVDPENDTLNVVV